MRWNQQDIPDQAILIHDGSMPMTYIEWIDPCQTDPQDCAAQHENALISNHNGERAAADSPGDKQK